MSLAPAAAPAAKKPKLVVATAAVEVHIPDSALDQIIAQYLFDSQKIDTLAALLKETKAEIIGPLSSSPDVTINGDDIRAQNWEAVVEAFTDVVPQSLAYDVLEHVCWELGPTYAQELTQKSRLLQAMKAEFPVRFGSLRDCPHADLTSRRAMLADKVDAFAKTTQRMQPKRLLGLVQDALKWKRLELGGERMAAMASPADFLSLYQPKPAALTSMHSHVFPTRIQLETKKIAKDVRVECHSVSPDGTTVAVGYSDGFVQLLGMKTFRIRKDLEYQAKDEPILLPKPVLSVAFNLDSTQLAVGDAEGSVFVYKVSDGKTLRGFKRAHTNGVVCLCFSPDSTRVLSGGVDSLGKILGLNSGSVLQQFRGHSNSLSSVLYLSGNRCITAGKDGVVKTWDASSGECVLSVTLNGPVLRVLNVDSFAPAKSGVAAWLRENRSFMVLTEKSVFTVEQDTGKLAATFNLQEPMVDLCSLRSGAEMIGVTKAGSVVCWDVGSQQNFKLVRKIENDALLKINPAMEEVICVNYTPQVNSVIVLTTSRMLALE